MYKLCKLETSICDTKKGVTSNSKDGHVDAVKMEMMHSGTRSIYFLLI